MSKQIVLSGAEVIDPAHQLEEARDVLIEDGLVKGIERPGSFAKLEGAEVIDVAGCWITPGLIDIHVHLREPGQEWKETVATGCAAAVAGGFTHICCMPNTKPRNDSASVTELVLEKAREANLCHVHPIGAVTINIDGKALAPLLELHRAGCVAFSDDGNPVWNAGIMRRALEYSSMFGGILAVHEEEKQLSEAFSMHEGVMSAKLGLVGMPGAAEDVMIARDIELARLTRGRVHFCHVSTGRAVELIRRAKNDGISVTAEATPHHFTLDASHVGDYDTMMKMSMPLRDRSDVEALFAGLVDGTIDCVASDHAPHEWDSKNKEFDQATFGILGLQTTVPLVLERVRKGDISRKRAVESMTSDPARCFNLDAGKIRLGGKADLTVIDPKLKYRLTPQFIRSKSKNTPFLDKELEGAAVLTFADGRKVYRWQQ